MRETIFPAENYTFDETTGSYKIEGRFIGLFEAIYTLIQFPHNPNMVKEKRDLKIVKRLKTKLKEISIYKDQGKDSRILIETARLILEEDEYDMLHRLLKDIPVIPAAADDVSDMFDLIDNIPPFIIKKE